MLQVTYSAGLNGVNGFPVTVECNCSTKMEKFDVVGLPDAAVKEARERIRAAIENAGYDFPAYDITVNMAPADKKKSGSSYDLAMIIGILGCCGLVNYRTDLSDYCFIGEISLSGQVRGVHGVLCMCLAARDAGKKKIFVPYENAPEASVTGGAEIYGVKNVREVINHLMGDELVSPTVFDKSIFESTKSIFDADFSDVKGQDRAKRALEIAAAGGHNILLIGPPGSGKSMLAKRIPSILPPLEFDEAIETTKLHSISGLLPENTSLITQRPFRSPHHTLSDVAMAGGGAIPMPGEISLSHNGVLFLDELPEFSKQATEVLRQPLEDRRVTITRTAGRFTFPCSFMLVCAMNPCRCGFYGHPSIPCTCGKKDISNYLNKISGPLLDRIDIQIEVPALPYDDISSNREQISSAQIRERVIKARSFAVDRFKKGGEKVFSNAQMEPAQIRKYCQVDERGSAMLKNAFDKMGLSGRGYDRVLRLSRTIADLDGSENIEAKHIAEAIQLRSLDRKYK